MAKISMDPNGADKIYRDLLKEGLSINPKKGVHVNKKKKNFINVRKTVDGRRKSVRYGFRKNPVSYVYSRNSRVVQGTENLLAVKLKDGTKGWLTKDSRFIAQDDMANLMKSLDGTIASSTFGFTFDDVWNRMSAAQRAKLADALRDMDWEEFWKQEYDPNDPINEKWFAQIAQLIDIVDSIVN